MDEAEMAQDVVGMAKPRRTDSIQSEFSYEDFFENGIVALHVVGPDGVIQHANKAELELLGYGADEYIGHHLADFYRDRHVLDEILTRLKRGENIHRHPVRMRARNGSIKHVQVTSSPQFQDGVFISSRCFTVDVTDLEVTRAALDRKDDQFRQILESLPVAVYTTDRDGKITYFNRVAAELAGREPEIGKDEWCVTFRLFTPDGKEMPHAECPMAIALKEDRPVRNVEAVAQRPDGTFFPFLPYPTPLRDENDELVGAVNVLVDLSERKMADQVSQQLSAIVESSFDAIVSKDLNGVIKTWNRAAERLFGYSADEAIGKSVTMLTPTGHPDEEARILGQIRQGEQIESFETIRQRKDGSLVPVSLTVSPMRGPGGNIVGASKIARDISARKESEYRIRMLMREVNHRVKNQYSVILSMIRETKKRAETQDVFERRVRERIMALSRSHDLLVSGDWKGATISELILAHVKPFGHEERISLSGPSLALSPNAVQYLGMAFHELAINSAKYGVLSSNKGQIAATWSIVGKDDARIFKLSWTERGGPEAGEQHNSEGGFGTLVLKRVSPQAISGTSDLRYGPHSVEWSLQAPMAFVDASQKYDAP